MYQIRMTSDGSMPCHEWLNRQPVYVRNTKTEAAVCQDKPLRYVHKGSAERFARSVKWDGVILTPELVK